MKKKYILPQIDSILFNVKTTFMAGSIKGTGIDNPDGTKYSDGPPIGGVDDSDEDDAPGAKKFNMWAGWKD